MTKFANDVYSKNIFFKISPGKLLLILSKLSKFEAPSCNGFWDINFMFSMSNFEKGHNSN